MMPLRGFVFFITFLAISCGYNHKLAEVKKLTGYPSSSGIEFYHKHFYIIGDDAKNILILDSTFTVQDSIPLYSFDGYRLPWQSKSDLESAGTVFKQKQQQILFLGSGSLPSRNTGWLLDPLSLKKDSIRLDTFFNLLQIKGIEELNIEGLSSIPGKVILSNRGNKTRPYNFLIITNEGFWENQSRSPVSLIRLGTQADSSIFQGVSGLAYAPGGDKLMLTVSTEDTKSAVEDGQIGKSFLWIINNFTSKLRWEGINPNRIIDLEAMDPRFKGHKIESICVTGENKQFISLVLVADNDDGNSTLFRMTIKK